MEPILIKDENQLYIVIYSLFQTVIQMRWSITAAADGLM